VIDCLLTKCALTITISAPNKYTRNKWIVTCIFVTKNLTFPTARPQFERSTLRDSLILDSCERFGCSFSSVNLARSYCMRTAGNLRVVSPQMAQIAVRGKSFAVVGLALKPGDSCSEAPNFAANLGLIACNLCMCPYAWIRHCQPLRYGRRFSCKRASCQSCAFWVKLLFIPNAFFQPKYGPLLPLNGQAICF